MECKICHKLFEPQHFNQKMCSLDCKNEARRISKEKYKKTDKGINANQRWIKSGRRNENEKRYRQKPRAKKLAIERTRRYLKEHPEVYKENLRKQSESKWWLKTEERERNKINTKKYRQTKKGKIANKNGKARRRSYLQDAGRFTLNEWEYIKWLYNYKCAMCQKKVKLTVDHIIPVSKGGRNEFENLQPLCKSCNSKKSNKII